MPGFDYNSIKKMPNPHDIAQRVQTGVAREDAFIVTKFGRNLDIDSGATEDIWAEGGTRPLVGAAETFDIVSSSAQDAVGGTGISSIRISGLDSSYNLIDEDITLTGTTPVTTTNSFTNIHRMVGLVAGSSNFNVGNITATGTTSANDMAQIPAELSITQMSHYMVPANYTGFLLSDEFKLFRASGGSSGERRGEVELLVKPFGLPIIGSDTWGLSAGSYKNLRTIPWIIPQLTLMWYRASADTNNSSFAVNYDLVCLHNDYIR